MYSKNRVNCCIISVHDENKIFLIKKRALNNTFKWSLPNVIVFYHDKNDFVNELVRKLELKISFNISEICVLDISPLKEIWVKILISNENITINESEFTEALFFNYETLPKLLSETNVENLIKMYPNLDALNERVNHIKTRKVH